MINRRIKYVSWYKDGYYYVADVDSMVTYCFSADSVKDVQEASVRLQECNLIASNGGASFWAVK